MSNFHQPEFECPSSETQIQVGKNLNYVIQHIFYIICIKNYIYLNLSVYTILSWMSKIVTVMVTCI